MGDVEKLCPCRRETDVAKFKSTDWSRAYVKDGRLSMSLLVISTPVPSIGELRLSRFPVMNSRPHLSKVRNLRWICTVRAMV